MTQVSVTRLRLRSPWLFPLFAWHSFRSLRQARAGDGCLAAQVNNFGGAFWTLTLWRDRAAMRAFMLSGAHRKVMPNLAKWCDEASVVHWDQEGTEMPSWPEGARRLGVAGRTSAVDHPSPAHAAGKPLGSST
jgi:hypothetical protein